MEYKKNNKDVILVNLSFIQNEQNLSQFLDFLSDKYIPKLKGNNYICNIKHTKKILSIVKVGVNKSISIARLCLYFL